MLSKDIATVSEHLQTWKLNLSTTKTISAVFHLNNNEAKRELYVNHNNKTLTFSEPVGQVADVSPTPRVTSPEADNTRRAPEAACWLWLGC